MIPPPIILSTLRGKMYVKAQFFSRQSFRLMRVVEAELLLR
jgi:hypothetical protein